MPTTLSPDRESVLHDQNTHTYIHHNGSRLQMLSETRKFLKASKNNQTIESFHNRLREAARVLDVQRITLYKVSGTMAEVILAVGDANDEILVTELSDINSNPNLLAAVLTGRSSNIPVEGVGIDAAFPIGNSGIILGVDATSGARKFKHKEILLLEFIAESIVHAYDAGKAIHKLGLDPLTGLWNRRALDGVIDDGKDIFGLSTPEVQGVAFLDIDHFKNVNDTYGHAVGDQILRRVGSVLNASIKTLGGTTYRYGGEEFVGLFHEEVSKERLELIRRAVEQDVHTANDIEFQVTVSVGLALKSKIESQEGNTQILAIHTKKRVAQTLARLADRALYKAKDNGRNQIVEWPFDEK